MAELQSPAILYLPPLMSIRLGTDANAYTQPNAHAFILKVPL